ncbi:MULTISPECIES: hypothetical protein [Pseudomonas]|uniref:DUF4879 domain-containing protein n=1 Tax=Pseudomonas mosselii TaxID=78327 RepID=A0A5R8ZBB9_9PSED|nr:hypothetical protein [Pseudomonas mosselii]TLP63103.1 hypothetical protein FEM01_06340 [Pseudomonas mosselii]
MQLKKRIFAALAVTSLFAAGAAYAGPPVQITVKNLGTADAKYSVIGNNEALTNSSATPKPKDSIAPNQAFTFVVTGPLSPDLTNAFVRYAIGGKTCVFRTAFVKTIAPGGLGGTITYIPKWTKDATASGGASCNATITSANLSNYSWNVEFTIK